jgi:acetate kinase
MGVTPLEGLPMGTRCGNIDPTIVSIIADLDGLSIGETMDVLNKESGMIGVSGVSNDFRDIETAAGIDINNGSKLEGANVNDRAKLALDIFNYSVAKFIGSYVIAMDGLDAIIFTAGVGENSPYTRMGICRHLSAIGICIDEEKNAFRGKGVFTDITAEGSAAKVYMIPTNEELVIARDTMEIIG